MTPLNVISSLKQASGSETFFEQRATNPEEQISFYFNQPVIKYRFDLIPKEEDKEKVKLIINVMRSSMKGVGIGLAHNQLSNEDNLKNPLAIFIIESIKGNVPFEAFINPVIVGFSSELTSFFHGCLSAIGMKKRRVSTFRDILMIYYDEDLKLVIKKFTEMSAIICQHEFNHLTTGGTYIDADNYCVNGDRFNNVNISWIQSIVGLFKSEKEISSLTRNHVLERCKHEIISNPSIYNDVIENYISSHPEDKPLYDNLLSLPDTDLTLYFESPSKYALEY